jgi:hypothetical protein
LKRGEKKQGMKQVKQTLVMEAIVVGVIFGVLLLLWGSIIGVPSTSGGLALLGFVVGAVAHVILEKTQVNSWYCSHGHACVVDQGKRNQDEFSEFSEFTGK